MSWVATMKNKKLIKPRFFDKNSLEQVSGLNVEFCDTCGAGPVSLQPRYTKNGCNQKLRCGWVSVGR
jgi:hypothetical protein